MNRIITVPINHIVEQKRFNPKYFNFFESKSNFLKKSDLKFERLGNTDYIPELTDGIHSAVVLHDKGNIKYLYVKNIREGFIDTTDNIYLDEVIHEENIQKELKHKDVLLTVVGTLGETALVSDYLEGKTSLPRNIAFMRVDEKKVLPEFLTCYFMSKFAKEQSIFSGGGNIQGLLSLTKLRRFIFPVPDMEVQKKFKDKYSNSLNLQKKILENIKKAKDILLNELDINMNNYSDHISFDTNILNLINNKIWTPTLYSEKVRLILNDIEKNHEMVQIKDIGNVIKGDEIGSENYVDYLEKTDEDIPFIRTSDIYNYEIDSYPSKYTRYEIFEELRQDFKEGDIIFNNDGRIGYPAIITSKDKCIYQSHIRRIRLKSDYKHLRNYLFICLCTDLIGELQFAKNTVIQSTIPTLANRFEDIHIPLINEKKILEINNIVEETIKLIECKHEYIVKIKEKMNKLLNYE